MRSHKSKYHNKRVTVGGETFDSVKEYNRWCELNLLKRAGEIRDLQRQVPFELIPAQRIDGKVVERSANYVSDFTYYDKAGNFVVEDTKGFKTPDYILKRKLMLHFHGIRIREV